MNKKTPSPSAAHNLSGKMVSRLKLVSVVMGVLIIVCVIALIYGITQKAGDLLGKPVDTARDPVGDIVSKLELEAGAKLHSIAGAHDGGLWLWVKADGRDQLLRLDAAGKPMGQVEIESK